MPLTPRPAGLVGGSATGLLALSGALAAQAQLAMAAKEDRAGVEAEGSRGEWAVQGGGEGTDGPPCPHPTHLSVRERVAGASGP